MLTISPVQDSYLYSNISVSYTHLTLPTKIEPCVDLVGRRTIQKKKTKK